LGEALDYFLKRRTHDEITAGLRASKEKGTGNGPADGMKKSPDYEPKIKLIKESFTKGKG